MEQQNAISELMVTLHRFHRQLAELEFRRKKGRQRIEMLKVKEAGAERELNEVLTRQQELDLAARNQENELAAREDAIARRKSQLGEAKTNKEYLSLKEQIESDEKINNDLADSVLAAIEEAENFQATVATARKAALDSKTARQQAIADFEQELPAIENDITTYQQRLSDAEKQLPQVFRPLYRELVQKLGGEEALAPVLNHKFCGNCNQQITIHQVTEICDGAPRLCQACGRLLFIPKDFVLQ
ncbi:MAG: hypothetical protein Q4G68_14710 [Planctomycetia bacterium]|nr:hypothetical protein [Planctomycetia bacterium]